jgi:hypothetical protein
MEEKTDYAPALVTDERHMEQEKFVLEIKHSISCIAIATDVGISPESVLHVLINSFGERKVCAKWIPHEPNDDQRAKRVILATTHLQMKMHSLITF